MKTTRTLAWRRAQALLKKQRKLTKSNPVRTSRKFMWRRRDKLFLRVKEGHNALHDDWSDES